MNRALVTLGLLVVSLAACSLAGPSDPSVEAKRILVFGATGVIGQSIVKEGLDRGHTVIGVSRSPEKFSYSQSNFQGARGNPTDTSSVAELVANVDAIVIAVGGRDATRPEETAMNLSAIAITEVLADTGARGPQVVVIGGGMTMQGSREKMIDRMPPSATEGSAMYALFLGHWEAYQTYLSSNINWTFLAPPMSILGFRSSPDVRTGAYRVAIDQHLISSEGKNEISMSDLAVAAIDFAESSAHNRQKVTVGY